MDDDVEILDVDDDNSPRQVPLKNQDLSQLSFTVGEFLSLYGWYLLAVTATVLLLIQHLRKRRTGQSRPDSVPQNLQDASLVTKRQEAMEVARQRMQAELDAKAAAFKEKQRQQEEEKRRQKIEEWESMKQGKSSKGHKLSENTEEASAAAAGVKPKTDKKPLRSNDYNPLMGQGGSCTWRPGRRGPSGGG